MAPTTCSIVVLGGVVCALLCVLMHAADAMHYAVGGSGGWTVGSDVQLWASQHTFYVGDDLYFPYPMGQSGVLLVGEEDYTDCNTSQPVSSDEGEGDMAISLMTAETYYFISAYPDQCSRGLRLAVDVQPAAPSIFSSPAANGIPSSPAILLTPPDSIDTPLSAAQSAPSPPRIDALTAALLAVALALAYTWLAP